MDVALLSFLILLNALFAMSEMALSASRKARLQVMLEAGEHGAQAAIDLHKNQAAMGRRDCGRKEIARFAQIDGLDRRIEVHYR